MRKYLHQLRIWMFLHEKIFRSVEKVVQNANISENKAFSCILEIQNFKNLYETVENALQRTQNVL